MILDLKHFSPCVGEGVEPGVLEQVKELVQSGCRASQQLERKGGIQVRPRSACRISPAGD